MRGRKSIDYTEENNYSKNYRLSNTCPLHSYGRNKGYQSILFDIRITMGWKIEYKSAEHIMEITLKGDLDFKTIMKIAFDNLKESKNYNVTHHLIDSSQLTSTVDRSDLFKLTSELYPSWGLPPNTKIAVLEPKNINAKMNAEFYIYAIKKLGWDSAMFANRKNALEWLKLE